MYAEPHFFPQKRTINNAQIDRIERHISELLTPLLAKPSALERSNLLKVIFKPEHDSDMALCSSVSGLRAFLARPAPEKDLGLGYLDNESTEVTRAGVIRAMYDICKTLGPSKEAESYVKYWQELQFEVTDTDSFELSKPECSSITDEEETEQKQSYGPVMNCSVS